MSTLKKMSWGLAPLVFFMLFPVLLSAQDMGGKQTMSVTGCLKQGTDSHGYYVTGQDGKMYELWGKGLSAHVNHTVTVTGSQATLSKAQEEKKEASEKAEAGGNSYVDLKVSEVKMVSETCK
jgi:hypothetical protein